MVIKKNVLKEGSIYVVWLINIKSDSYFLYVSIVSNLDISDKVVTQTYEMKPFFKRLNPKLNSLLAHWIHRKVELQCIHSDYFVSGFIRKLSDGASFASFFPSEEANHNCERNVEFSFLYKDMFLKTSFFSDVLRIHIPFIGYFLVII